MGSPLELCSVPAGAIAKVLVMFNSVKSLALVFSRKENSNIDQLENLLLALRSNIVTRTCHTTFFQGEYEISSTFLHHTTAITSHIRVYIKAWPEDVALMQKLSSKNKIKILEFPR